MRLDKYLSACGFGTRSEVKKMVKKGVVAVDDGIVRDQGFQIIPGKNKVTCSGKEAAYREQVYIMLNKPAGVVSATGDRWHDTVLDLLEGAYPERKLFPVGRLDRDATGLMLLTDDGALAHSLLSPKRHVAKLYEVVLNAPVDEADIAAFAEGLALEDFTAKPAVLAKLDGCRAEVELTEGKFHQVKRMFEAVGKTVLELKRTAIGPLKLDGGLQPGEWRELTAEEEATLRAK